MSLDNEVKFGSDKKTCKIDNSFSILRDPECEDSNNESDEENKPTTSVVINDKKTEVTDPSVKWGDITEPCDKNIINEIDKNISLMDYHDEQMVFLSSIISKSVSMLADIINKQKDIDATNLTISEKERVRNLHELEISSNVVRLSLNTVMGKINKSIINVEKEKNKIINDWNNIINDINTSTSTKFTIPVNEVNVLNSNNRSVSIRKPISYLNAISVKPEPQNDIINYVNAKIGKVAYTNGKNDNIVSIKFNDEKKCYVIKLDGKDYSFTDGSFIQRDRRNTSHTVIKYGKRCDPKRMRCSGATCTYYHDPLKSSQYGHTTRNLAMSYIMEELIKSVSDDEYIANVTGQNPFLVEDIVQLAGMLLIKAVAVKKILN
jgi:hypothetical protein